MLRRGTNTCFRYPDLTWVILWLSPSTPKHKYMNFLLLTFLNAAFPASQDWFSARLNSRLSEKKEWHKRHKKTETEGEWNGESVVLVSHICRDPAAPCLDFLIFSVCGCLRCFTKAKCGFLMSWERDSTINCLCCLSDGLFASVGHIEPMRRMMCKVLIFNSEGFSFMLLYSVNHMWTYWAILQFLTAGISLRFPSLDVLYFCVSNSSKTSSDICSM